MRDDSLQQSVTHFDLLQEQIRSINSRLSVVLWVMGIGFTSLVGLIVFIMTKL